MHCHVEGTSEEIRFKLVIPAKAGIQGTAMSKTKNLKHSQQELDTEGAHDHTACNRTLNTTERGDR
jgi:hypothetical protein